MNLPHTICFDHAPTRRILASSFALAFLLLTASSVYSGEAAPKGAKSLSPVAPALITGGKGSTYFSRANEDRRILERGPKSVEAIEIHKRRLSGARTSADGKLLKRALPPSVLGEILREKRARDSNVKSGMENKTYDHKMDVRKDWLVGATFPLVEGSGAGGSFCDNCVVGSVECDGGPVEGALTAGDCLLGDDTLLDIYTLDLKEAASVTVNLAADYDTFFFFVDADCFVVATNDDCVPGDAFSGSCLTVDLAAGLYHLVPNGFTPADAGPYTLDVTCGEITTCEDCNIGVVSCDETASGDLALPPADCDLGDGTALDLWSFTLPEVGRVTIDLVPGAVAPAMADPFLFIYGQDCFAFAADDDGGGGLTSRLVLDLDAGEYFIGANSFAPEAGSYDLTVGCQLGFEFCSDCNAGEVECGATNDGELTKDDCTVAASGAATDLYTFTATEAGRFVFTVGSVLFDPLVTVYDENCDVIAGGVPCVGDIASSCATVDLEAGSYVVGVASFAEGGFGAYTLTNECLLGFDFCADCVTGDLECDSEIEAVLDEQSCVLAGDGSFISLYPFSVVQDGPIIVDLQSAEFDCFLWLYDADCNPIATNDDGGVGLNSLLVADLTTGDYLIGVNSFAAGEIGTYNLALSCPDVRVCRDCNVGAVECDVPVDGTLTGDDCALDDGSNVDVYSLEVAVATVVDVSVTSGDFDTLVFVSDQFCQRIAENDDCSPDDTDSCLESLILEPGSYSFGVTSFGAGESGAYQLTLSCEEFDPCVHCVVGEVICGDTVNGEITQGDCPLGDGSNMDLWELTLDEPTAVSIELESFAFDPFVFLLDEGCFQIGANNDCPTGDLNVACMQAWLEPGTYYIVANSFTAGKSGEYDIRVTCTDPAKLCVECEVSLIGCDEDFEGTHPTAADCVSPRGFGLDIISFVLPEDDLATISILGDYDTYLHLFDEDCLEIAADDDGGPGLNSLIAMDLPAGTYFIGVSSFGAGQGGAYTLTANCGEVPVDEFCGEACTVGEVDCGGDVNAAFPQSDCLSPRGAGLDSYTLELAEQTNIAIDLTADYDTYLHLFDENCVEIAIDDDGGDGFNSRLVRNLEPGTYYIGASSFAAGAVGSLNLSVVCSEVVDLCGEDCVVGEVDCGGNANGAFPQSACVSERGMPLDVYTLEVDEAANVVVDLTADYDTYLHLFDENCVAIAFDDDGGDGLNSRLALDLQPGTYYVGASSFGAAAGTLNLDVVCGETVDLCGNCEVQLMDCGETVNGAFPQAAGCVSARGAPLDTYSFSLATAGSVTINLSGDYDTYLHLLDANCLQIAFNDDINFPENANSTLTLELPAGDYYVGASSFAVGAVGNLTLEILCEGGGGGGDCEDCVAGSIGSGSTQNGELVDGDCTAADDEKIDIWVFEVTAPFSGTIDLSSDAFDTTLALLNAECSQVAFNDDANAGTLNSQLSVDLEVGSYFLRVSSVFAEEAGAYTLAVSGDADGVGPFSRGDFDGNGRLELTDGVQVFNFLFLGGAGPGCAAAADAGAEGQISLSAGVYVLNFLFLGGPPPDAPFPDCGVSSLATDEALGCETPHTCD